MDSKEFESLDYDTQECCVKLFSYYFLVTPTFCSRFGGAFVSGFLSTAVSVQAVLDHFPELMSVKESSSHRLDAYLVAKYACKAAAAAICEMPQRYRELEEKHASMILEIFAGLPSTDEEEEAFYLQVDAVIKSWMPHNSVAVLEKGTAIIALYKRKAASWRARFTWISACINIAHNCTDASRACKKLCL